MAKPEKAKISIHSPQSEPERERVYAFRYRVLVGRQGGTYVHADDERGIIKDLLDKTAFHLFLMADNSVVASIRINVGGTTDFPADLTGRFQLEKFRDFKDTELSVTSRLVVAPGARSSQLSAVLLGAAYKVVRGQASRFDFANTTHVTLSANSVPFQRGNARAVDQI